MIDKNNTSILFRVCNRGYKYYFDDFKKALFWAQDEQLDIEVLDYETGNYITIWKYWSNGEELEFKDEQKYYY